MTLALAYWSILLVLFVFAWRANRGFGRPGMLVTGVYLFSASCMLVIVSALQSVLSLESTAYFLFILLLFILPHISTKKLESKTAPQFDWSKKYTYYSFFVAAPCVYALLSFLPLAVSKLGSDSIEGARMMVYSGQTDSNISMLALLCVGFWPVALTLFVYAYLAGQKRWLVSMLGIGSFAGAVYGIASLGRSGVVYWILFLCIILSHTWRFVKVRVGSNLKFLKVASVLGVTLSLVFLFGIAYARNLGAGSSANGINSRFGQVIYSLADYTGQGLVNFQDFWFFYDDFGELLYGQRNFPLYCGIAERLGLMGYYSAAETNIIYKHVYDAYNLEQAVFCGFQRELMMDFGRVGTALLGGAYFLISRASRRRLEKRLTMSNLMLTSFLMSIPVLGVFFFSYGELWANISIAAILVTVVFFKFSVPRKDGADSLD